MVQGIFIAREPYYFAGVESLKSHLLLIAIIKDKYILDNIKQKTHISCTILMRDKYLLQNINGDGNIVGL